MQEVITYIPIGLVIFFIAGLVAVNKEITKRPTWNEANERFKETKVCDEIHKSVNEKLDCIPEMKERQIRMETKIDLLVENNGKK